MEPLQTTKPLKAKIIQLMRPQINSTMNECEQIPKANEQQRIKLCAIYRRNFIGAIIVQQILSNSIHLKVCGNTNKVYSTVNCSTVGDTLIFIRGKGQGTLQTLLSIATCRQKYMQLYYISSSLRTSEGNMSATRNF